MLGSGVGFKCTLDMAKNIAPIRVDTKLIIAPYEPVPDDYRLEDTSVRILITATPLFMWATARKAGVMRCQSTSNF